MVWDGGERGPYAMSYIPPYFSSPTHIRWGSHASAMERAAEQQPALEEAYKQDDRGRRTRANPAPIFPPDKRLDSETFDALIDLLSILEPFRQFTTALQADTGTAGMVVPAINKLFRIIRSPTVTRTVPASGPNRPGTTEVVPVARLHEAVQEIRQAMYNDMIMRFSWNNLRTFAISSLVDPRYKVRTHACSRCY
jgi:hypothetical protein